MMGDDGRRNMNTSMTVVKKTYSEPKPWLNHGSSHQSPVTSARSNHSCGNMGLEGLVDFERKLGLTGCSIAWGVGAAQICQNPCGRKKKAVLLGKVSKLKPLTFPEPNVSS